jgi:glycosyltransferase involved in cell wall biosynthesis
MTSSSPAPRASSVTPPPGCVSIVMPAYNERRTIRDIVARVLALREVGELIIVDDGSADGTRDILRELAQADSRIRLEMHEHNKGKGAAVRRGLELATRDYVLVQDADLEYDPEEIPALLVPLVAGLADVVYGSRFAPREHRRVLFFRHELGNRLLTFLSNLLTDYNLTDMETCYKAFRRSVIQNLRLECDRFGFEPEVTARLAKSPVVLYEVPISYHGRTYAQGKKIGWKDGVAAFWFIAKFNLSPSVRDEIRRPWSEIADLVQPH